MKPKRVEVPIRKCAPCLGRLARAALIATLWFSFRFTSVGQTAPANDLLTGRELYKLIAGQLQDRLARSDRLTLLPRNLNGVYIADGQNPVFAMSGDDASAATNLTRALETYAMDHDGFRLVQGAEVMGLAGGEAVLAAAQIGRGPQDIYCAIVGAGGVQRVLLPAKLGVTGARRALYRWCFCGSGGLLVPDISTGFTNFLAPPFQSATLFAEPNEVTYAAFGGQICIAVQNEQGTREQRVALRRHGIQAVVGQRNGTYLTIGDERILPLEDAGRAQPSEEALTAVWEAASKGDRAAYLGGLETVSRYPRESLSGLCKLLDGLPNPGREVEGIRQRADWLLNLATDRPPNQAVSPQSVTNLNQSVAAFRRDTKQFLADLDALTGGLGIAPHQAALLLERNYQFFDGQWIAQPRLAGQHNLRAAELELTYLDSFQPRTGVFRLTAEGHLTLLADYDKADHPDRQVLEDLASLNAPCQCFKSQNGEDLALFPHVGLARMGNGRLQWLDRSEEFKSIREVIGVDNAGRIYFRAGPYDDWNPAANGAQGKTPDCLWVYGTKGKAPESRARNLIPVNSAPIMDAKSNVWFLTAGQGPRQSSKGDGSLADSALVGQGTEMIRIAKERWMQTAEWPAMSGFRSGSTLDLYCLGNGQAYHCMSNLAYSTELIPGAAGGVIGIAKARDRRGAFLIDDQGTVAATNLHELAQRDFDRLLRQVPERNPQPDLFVPAAYSLMTDGYPAVCRLGAFVCVAQDGKLEAYRRGKPFGLGERLLSLSPGNLAGLLVLGALTVSNHPSALFYFTGYRGNHPRVIWAVAGDDGIGLLPAMLPDGFFQESEYRSLHGISVFNVGGPPDFTGPGLRSLVGWQRHLGPLVASAAQCIYFPRSADEACAVLGPDWTQTLQNAGVPALAMANGDLVVQRISPYKGYRICAGNARQDIRPTYSRNLRVLEETPDGQLLCCGPEGLVWLSRDSGGNFVSGKELRLSFGDFISSIVGETSSEMFLTVIDRASQAYLAVVEK